MKNINTDFYMTTEHRRKEKKGRVRFSMVMNKVLVGTIVLATLANPMSTAYAASTTPEVKMTNTTVERQYEQSVENAMYKVQTTIAQLEEIRATQNAVSKTLLSEMASGLLELESSIRLSGKTATAEVYSLLDRAEATLKGVPESYVEAQTAKKAINTVRASLGVSAYIEEENAKAVTLSDISGHWGKGYIEKLVAKGGISGYPDGTFRPNNSITRAEFVTIAVRSALNGQVADKTSDHWASGVFESAREQEVLLMNDFPAYDWDKPISRYEMAYVMVRITENIFDEATTDARDVSRIMSDYQEVSKQQKYKYYVEQAFMKGMLSGKTADGLFDGKANGTRAEAATMVVRMLDKAERGVVNPNKSDIASDSAKEVFNKIPTYQAKTDHGLVFGDIGYTLDDVAVFAQGYLSVRTNYDGTNKAAMDKWEKELNEYVTTVNIEGTQTMKSNILSKQEKAVSDVFVDASKIEIRDGRFFVHAVVYNKTTNKTWEVEIRIGGHDINKSEIAVGIVNWTEVK